jgi:asparagine synthetase B (glutamine-hydrolysing)
VPFEYRFENSISKYPLKSLFKNYLPEDIINRKKVGFPVPISKIFNNNNDPMDQWLEFNIRTLNIEY